MKPFSSYIPTISFIGLALLYACSHPRNKQDKFIIKWIRFSQQMEETARLPFGILADQDTGFLSRGNIPISDSVHIKTIIGQAYEGLLYWKGEKLVCLLDDTKQEVILFDFSMKPGDTTVIDFQNEPSDYVNRGYRDAEDYKLILEWKHWDTCLMDTVYMFRYDHGQFAYFDSDSSLQPEIKRKIIRDLEDHSDEIFFVGRKAGVLGYVRGQHFERNYVKTQYINALFGRMYFSYFDLVYILPHLGEEKKMAYLESHNYFRCLAVENQAMILPSALFP